jgi:hypothetical protein
MVRIRVREGFWGLVVWSLLAGCAVVGTGADFFNRHPPQWLSYLLGGCAVAMLMFGPIRDLIEAWRKTEER